MECKRLYLFPGQENVSEVCLQRAANFIKTFDAEKEPLDINDLLELGTAVQILSLHKKIDKTSGGKYLAIIAKRFAKITDDNLSDIVSTILKMYWPLFWRYFDKFQLCKRISSNVFYALLEANPQQAHHIFHYKKIVNHYDDVLAEYIRKYNVLDILILPVILKAVRETSGIFLPKNLKDVDYQAIYQRYINSCNPHSDILRLLVESNLQSPHSVSQSTELAAKKRHKNMIEENLRRGSVMQNKIDVSFLPLRDNEVYDCCYEDGFCKFHYDVNLLNERLDYPEILDNFIYIFQYMDLYGQATCVSLPSEMGILEQRIGYHSDRTYRDGIAFKMKEVAQFKILKKYICFLKQKGICIEKAIEWVFSEYLPRKFQIEGFSFLAPSENTAPLEKIRFLFPEIEGIRNQFDLYVRNGKLNYELIYLDSTPKLISEIGSLLKKKYLYINPDHVDLGKECQLLFSSQSILLCNENESIDADYSSFFKMCIREKINIADYPDFEDCVKKLYWLQSRKSLYILDDGTIKLNHERVIILYHLFHDCVICSYYYPFNKKNIADILKAMIEEDELVWESSLFNRKEQDYLDYMLNKSKFDNGLDLRNRYLHGNNTFDIGEQEEDYIKTLKIAILTVLKISEDIRLYKNGANNMFSK